MKALKWFLSTLYFSLLTYIVFFARRREQLVWDDGFLNLVPFVHTIQGYHQLHYMPPKGQWDFYTNLFGNVVLFMPLPFILIVLFRITNKYTIILLGAGLSIAIELTQYIFQIGIPDIDDVLLNTGGVVAGLVCWLVIYRVKFLRRVMFAY
jgi:glycopeptide antibiotics resistance protein